MSEIGNLNRIIFELEDEIKQLKEDIKNLIEEELQKDS
jgi:hypothetical protein